MDKKPFSDNRTDFSELSMNRYCPLEKLSTPELAAELKKRKDIKTYQLTLRNLMRVAREVLNVSL